MDTPEERLAALVAQAEKVLLHRDCGETINPDAIALAESVIKHGKTAGDRAGSFSFALPDPEPDATTEQETAEA